ncbi:uncharacterized protein EV420DRAFT_809208 [Desarmillaria tabescens]|uniref:Uncharacterized protein n=1 Tax=Armillaria tabescens TaxID=1929756 RepID=A0AA39NI65_ARMTA|nr:uncharacterized protein EV420DRAFT_809208 [Desarmillaria tabescens]KAK0466085.1 hypothetical protein EV420DRAFT_809208 [Desarmillaria tabescens]
MVPHIDEYVIVQLDPVTSLKRLNDLEVTRACETLVAKKYVACITWMQPLILDTEYISVSLKFVSNGVSRAHLAEHLLPEMTVPIYPNTQHPLSRPPFRPSKEIPWPQCYQTTQLGGQVRWRNVREAGRPVLPAKYELPAKDAAKLQMLSSEDGAWRLRLVQEDCKERNITSHDAGHEFQDHVSDDVQDPPSRTRSFMSSFLDLFPCTSDSVSLHSDDNCSECSDDNLKNGIYAFNKPPSDTMPVAILSNDLASLPAEEIGDPWDFNREGETLKRIEEEHYARTRAAREKPQALDTALDKPFVATRPDSKPSSSVGHLKILN